MSIADIIPFVPRLADPTELERRERRIRRDEERERRIRVGEARAAFERSIPAQYADAALDAPWLRALVGDDAVRRAERAINDPLVVFMGPTGAGKTSLAVAMAKARGDWGARFAQADLLAVARSEHRLGDGPPAEEERARRAALLVLDDLGQEMQLATSSVPLVVLDRFAHKRPTWVTTGQSPNAIAARYGGGVARRLLQGATFIRLAGAGPSAGRTST